MIFTFILIEKNLGGKVKCGKVPPQLRTSSFSGCGFFN